ncbi:hypothetical protein ACFL0M_06140 [Thermodesulfobacteriota bacterium]
MINKPKDLALKIAGGIFGLVALAHLVRIFLGTVIVIGPLNVPRWASGIAVVGAGVLSVWLFRLSRE